jgi:glutaredoxin-like YruB-family protein
MEIKIYSTPTCPYCVKAKEYLASKGVEYQAFDVSQDKAALDEMVKTTGQMGVPVILVGSEIIVGFDKQRLDSLLGG